MTSVDLGKVRISVGADITHQPPVRMEISPTKTTLSTAELSWAPLFLFNVYRLVAERSMPRLVLLSDYFRRYFKIHGGSRLGPHKNTFRASSFFLGGGGGLRWDTFGHFWSSWDEGDGFEWIKVDVDQRWRPSLAVGGSTPGAMVMRPPLPGGGGGRLGDRLIPGSRRPLGLD